MPLSIASYAERQREAARKRSAIGCQPALALMPDVGLYLRVMELKQHRYSQAVKRKRRIGWLHLLVAGIFMLTAGYTTLALTAPVDGLRVALEAPYTSEPEPVPISWPRQGAAAVGSADQGVLATSENAQTPLPIASMTKVVTALAVMERAPYRLGETGRMFTLDADDAQLWRSYLARGGSVFPVHAGQTLTQQQALEALLVISGNNIADSLAIKLFGSLDEYVAFANKLVSQIYGLQHTTITDASGFSQDTVSTPGDMILIGQKLLEQPVLAAIVAKRQVSLPGIGVVTNTNRLLADEGVIGVKTGTTYAAGYCLLFAADHVVEEGESVRIIGVVMGSVSANGLLADARQLLASAKQGFGRIEVVPAGARFGSAHSEWDQSASLVTKEPLAIFGWKADAYEAVAETEVLMPATLESGQPVGLVRAHGTTVQLVSDDAVTRPSIWWRLTNYF